MFFFPMVFVRIQTRAGFQINDSAVLTVLWQKNTEFISGALVLVFELL